MTKVNVISLRFCPQIYTVNCILHRKVGKNRLLFPKRFYLGVFLLHRVEENYIFFAVKHGKEMATTRGRCRDTGSDSVLVFVSFLLAIRMQIGSGVASSFAYQEMTQTPLLLLLLPLRRGPPAGVARSAEASSRRLSSSQPSAIGCQESLESRWPWRASSSIEWFRHPIWSSG